MKKILALIIFSLVFCQSLLAQPVTGSPTLWEKAAFGEIPGIQMVRLVGINVTPTTTFEPLWKEATVYNTSNIPLFVAMTTPYCASTDANDTSAGTGARTIRVSGIDTSFTAFTETVTMNGQTSVNLATANVQFIYKIEVLTTGSGGLNAGIVRCGTGANTGGAPAVVHAHLAISSATVATGDGNVSQMFFYAVPDNYSLLCTNFVTSSVYATAANVQQFVIDTFTNNDIRKRIQINHGEAGGGNPANNPTMIKFPEKTILIGMVQGGGTASAMMAADCLLISDAWEDSPQVIF